MRVVVDTNVFVRALINGASPLLQLWYAGQIQLVISAETLAELYCPRSQKEKMA